MQHRSRDETRPESPSGFRNRPRDAYGSDTVVDCGAMVLGGGVGNAVTGLMSGVKQALEEGGCDTLARARVLNLLEQDAVGRDLDNLRILIELARSEKSLASTQQSLAAKESEAAALSQKTVELEQANAALVKRAHQNRKSGSSELQERLHDALSQLQQLRADFEDKQVRRPRPLRARSARLTPQRRSSATACCACVIFLWKSYPQLICSFKPSTRCMPRCSIQHGVHAAALTASYRQKSALRSYMPA